MDSISLKRGIISTTNYHATNAAHKVLKKSGNAIDAAIAAASVLSVTSQHQCGIGGDLFAMIFKNGKVFALNSSGFSGSKLQEYSKEFSKNKIKTFKDPRLITIPGAVDGWLELHKKFGTRKISEIFKDAIELANDGFECDQSLFNAIENSRKSFFDNPLNQVVKINQIVKRPKIANQLEQIKKSGRKGFYQGLFGDELISLTKGSISKSDLDNSQADWVKPISQDFFGQKFWTIPPNSQSFLILKVLKKIKDKYPKFEFDNLDNLQLKICKAMLDIGHSRDKYLSNFFNLKGSDTNYLCIVDQNGMGISMVQSNAHGFGSQIVLNKSGVFLHNRGLGFINNQSEFLPKNYTKPPSTLCPLLVTKKNKLEMLTGTMGADSQPQIILQNWANYQFTNNVAQALKMPRWIIAGNEKQNLFPFNTWKGTKNSLNFLYEKGTSKNLLLNLKKAHNIKTKLKIKSPNLFGHCQMIVANKDKKYSGCHDPRSLTGKTTGL